MPEGTDAPNRERKSAMIEGALSDLWGAVNRMERLIRDEIGEPPNKGAAEIGKTQPAPPMLLLINELPGRIRIVSQKIDEIRSELSGALR